MTNLNAMKAERSRMRRYAGMSVKARLELEAAQRRAASLSKDSAEGRRAELQSRIMLGQKDATDIDMRDVDARGLALDGMAFAGRMNKDTKISRAVKCSFDRMDINAAKLSGPITASTFRGSSIRNVNGSNINRDGCNFDGSVQGFNDWSRGSSRNQSWGRVNAYANSHDQSDMDGLKMHGGWMTQGYFGAISMNGGKIVNTGLENSTFDDIYAERAQLRPRETDTKPSLRGAKLKNCEINPIIAEIAHDDNATLDSCRIVYDVPVEKAKGPNPKAPHDRFQALRDAHAAVMTEGVNNDDMIAGLYRPVRSLRGAAMAFGLSF